MCSGVLKVLCVPGCLHMLPHGFNLYTSEGRVKGFEFRLSGP